MSNLFRAGVKRLAVWIHGMGLAALARRCLEPIWLGAAISRAEAVPEAARGRVSELAWAARRRAAAARSLLSDEYDIAALTLEREAFCHAVSALEAARGEAAAGVLAPSVAWQRYESRLSVAEREQLGSVLANDDTLALETLDPRTLRRMRLDVERALGPLLALAEPRSARELRVSRALRSTGLALLLCGGLGVALWAALAPHHVGRYKPVSSSSLRSGSQPIAALTDDTVSQSNLATTNVEESPWVRVDLLGRFRVVRVVLHAASPSPPDMLPLVLEVADADEHYREVAKLGTPEGLRATLDGAPVRYVRLRHPGRGSISATEIDVLAK